MAKMSNMSNMKILTGIFIILILILLLSPSLLKNLYSSTLGRIILIIVVLFFAMSNVTLGLFTALLIILASHMSLKEGLDNMDSSTMQTSLNTPVRDAIKDKVQSNQTTAPPTTASTSSSGVDLETIKNSIKSQASASLPTTPPTSSEDIAPSSTEPFRSMYSTI